MELNVKANVYRVLQMNKLAIAKFVIPFCLAGAAGVLFWLFTEPEVYATYAAVLTTYFFMPLFGTEAAIFAGLHPNFGIPLFPAALIAFMVFVDATLSLFLVWNLDYAKKIPYLGKLVEWTEAKGEKALRKYKWAERLGFIGLTAFVMIPFQYTGAAVGSIAGRILGMTSLMTWLAVVLGSFFRSTLITLVYMGVLSFF